MVLNRGRLQFSEEMVSLTERFREVELTVDGTSRVPASSLPSSWLNAEQSGSLIRFVETQFERDRTMTEIRRLFENVKQVAVKAMPLRSIFVTPAKASRRVV